MAQNGKKSAYFGERKGETWATCCKYDDYNEHERAKEQQRNPDM